MLHWRPWKPWWLLQKTWVELAVLQVVGEEKLVAEHIQPALDFHRKVTGQAGAHLALVADNTFITPWMAAKPLSKNSAFAQAAAKDLAQHLAVTKPSNMISSCAPLVWSRNVRDNLQVLGSSILSGT